MQSSFFARIARLALVPVLGLLPLVAGAQAGAVADYRFQQSFDDSLGIAPPLQRLMPSDGSFATENVFGHNVTVFRFGEGTGFQVPVAGLLDWNVFTIAVIVRFDQADHWVKIIDTKLRGPDDGLYVISRNLQLYPHGPTSSEHSFRPDTWHQVVLTRDAAGLARVYIDGNEQFSVDDLATGHAALSPERVLTFFRDDHDTADSENGAGAVARIRLFNRALTASEVRSLEIARPDLVFAHGFELPA